MRRCMHFIDLQIEIQVLTPHSRLEIEQPGSLNWHRHVGHHRDEVVRVRGRLAEAIVVVVVAQHAYSFAATS